MLEQAELFLCDGLAQVQPEGITDVVIAGMGGETIIHILEDCPWRRQVHLILQPMTKIPDLGACGRAGLFLDGTGSAGRGKVLCGLSVFHSSTPGSLSLLEQEVGCLDWQSQTARRYAGWKQQRFQKLAQQLRQAQRPEAEQWETLAETIQKKLQETDGKGETSC